MKSRSPCTAAACVLGNTPEKHRRLAIISTLTLRIPFFAASRTVYPAEAAKRSTPRSQNDEPRAHAAIRGSTWLWRRLLLFLDGRLGRGRRPAVERCGAAVARHGLCATRNKTRKGKAGFAGRPSRVPGEKGVVRRRKQKRVARQARQERKSGNAPGSQARPGQAGGGAQFRRRWCVGGVYFRCRTSAVSAALQRGRHAAVDSRDPLATEPRGGADRRRW